MDGNKQEYNILYYSASKYNHGLSLSRFRESPAERFRVVCSRPSKVRLARAQVLTQALDSLDV